MFTNSNSKTHYFSHVVQCCSTSIRPLSLPPPSPKSPSTGQFSQAWTGNAPRVVASAEYQNMGCEGFFVDWVSWPWCQGVCNTQTCFIVRKDMDTLLSTVWDLWTWARIKGPICMKTDAHSSRLTFLVIPTGQMPRLWDGSQPDPQLQSVCVWPVGIETQKSTFFL